MILRVHPGTLRGQTVWAPPSKSIMQRVVALATLAEGTTMVRRPSESDDCTQALMMAAQLGADIELGEDALAIHGRFPLAPRTKTLTPGESGLGMRLFTALAALHDQPLTIQREGTLVGRPTDSLSSALAPFGGKLQGDNELTVCGPLGGADATLDAANTSQALTGLVVALAHAPGDSALTVHHVVSRPYIDMTLEVAEDMGLEVELEELPEALKLTIPGGQRAKAMNVTIDGDWSAGAFLMVLGALCADHHLDVEGLLSTYTQADEQIKGAMLFAGCKLAGTDEGVRVFAGKAKAIQMDLTDCPDLFPPLATLAAFAKGPSTLKGIHRLTGKESKRATTIQSEWANVGIRVDLDEATDTMTIHPAPIQAGRIETHGDHRLAMAAALFGAAGAPVEIVGSECVAKSYPAFFDDLESLGLVIHTVTA